MNFSVNKDGKIRFGLSAIKGVGEGPVETILSTKKETGKPYESVFDMVRRINLKVANKKCFESLAYAGAFDGFGLERAHYFTKPDGKYTFLEMILRYGNAYQKQKAEMAFSLFGASAADETMPEPKTPEEYRPWSLMEKLKNEKEVTGIYLSGHPLDDYRLEISKFTKPISRLEEFKDQEVAIAAIVNSVNHRVSQKGSLFGFLNVEDCEGSTLEFGLFGNSYLEFRHLLEPDMVLYIKGKYQKSWRDESQYELRINEIQLLEEIGNAKIKGINLLLPIQRLNARLIEQLEQICTKYAGEQQFSVTLLDGANKIKLQLDSGSYKVNADTLFTKELEKMELKFQMMS
jgi:DNA polymerase-3 subunit alpha